MIKLAVRRATGLPVDRTSSGCGGTPGHSPRPICQWARTGLGFLRSPIRETIDSVEFAWRSICVRPVG
jgi:hypothetical protein